jgi:hypothetical protein
VTADSDSDSDSISNSDPDVPPAADRPRDSDDATGSDVRAGSGADADTDADAGRDPTALSVLAVTTGDAVAALASNRQRDRGLVLRVTPPFHGRQRARLHDPVAGADPAEDGSLALDPERLFVDPPAYPTADDTAAALRARDAYDRDRHRERHVEALADWRDRLRDCRADAVDVPAPTGPHEVRVVWLGE